MIIHSGSCAACREGEPGPALWTDEPTITNTGALAFEPIDIAEATDVAIDGSGLDTDLQGAPLDPTTLDVVG